MAKPTIFLAPTGLLAYSKQTKLWSIQYPKTTSPIPSGASICVYETGKWIPVKLTYNSGGHAQTSPKVIDLYEGRRAKYMGFL